MICRLVIILPVCLRNIAISELLSELKVGIIRLLGASSTLPGGPFNFYMGTTLPTSGFGAELLGLGNYITFRNPLAEVLERIP